MTDKTMAETPDHRTGVSFLSLNVDVHFLDELQTQADVIAMLDKIRFAIAAVVPTPYVHPGNGARSLEHVDVEIAESVGVPTDTIPPR